MDAGSGRPRHQQLFQGKVTILPRIDVQAQPAVHETHNNRQPAHLLVDVRVPAKKTQNALRIDFFVFFRGLLLEQEHHVEMVDAE